MNLFYELIRVALGNQCCLTKTPTEEEWIALAALAEKQAVGGVAYTALDVLGRRGQKPPLDVLLSWLDLSEQIKAQNALTNKRCLEVTRMFAAAGFRSCILKGQGNGLLYAEELGMYRQSGDIDIWIDGTREEIRSFVKSKVADAEDGDLHIQFPIFGDVPVEVHYKPRYSSIPKYDRRLQAWFREQAEQQFTHHVALLGSTERDVCVPTATFNVIHQMSHLMGHFFVEGIGLRQFIDYYFVLRRLHEEGCQDDFKALFERLGMLKFATGVMWIELQLLGLEAQYLLVEPSERIGRLLQQEIEEGGNFGHHDERYKVRKKGYLMRGMADGYRLLKLASVFPSEAFWKLWGKAVNQKWKVINKLG